MQPPSSTNWVKHLRMSSTLLNWGKNSRQRKTDPAHSRKVKVPQIPKENQRRKANQETPKLHQISSRYLLLFVLIIGSIDNSQVILLSPQEPLPISKIEMDYSKWTKPKYGLKYRSHVDMQNYCTEFQRQDMDSNVPDEIVLTIDLPLLKDSSSLDADVVDDGDGFELKSDEKALYWVRVLYFEYNFHVNYRKN